MKYLFVGDVHNHNYMFNDIYRLDKEYSFNRIILIGDYVDDWNTDNHKSLETLNTIISMKQNMKDKFTLLLGNHELSYMGYPCSGHKYELEDAITKKLKENIDLFDLATSVNCDGKVYVCSHAGFCNDFINELINNEEYYESKLYYRLVNINMNKLQYLYLFSKCSYRRGGHDDYSSCLWCDRMEHIELTTQEYPLIPYQIIGHSPTSTISNITGDRFSYYFIDTHSTYRDGTEFGDKSYLMWNEDKFEIIY